MGTTDLVVYIDNETWGSICILKHMEATWHLMMYACAQVPLREFDLYDGCIVPCCLKGGYSSKDRTNLSIEVLDYEIGRALY